MNTLRLFFVSLVATLALMGCPSAPRLDLPEPPRIDTFKATPPIVARGAMVELEWVTTNASDVELLEVGKGPVAIDNKKEGKVSLAIDAQSLFVLNAANSRGVKVTALVTVAVEGSGQQVMFAALPARIERGASSTLVWSAPGAHVVTITPEGGAALDLAGQVQAGSVVVSPTAPTRYTLNADGALKTVDVDVGQAIIEFTASKFVADAGEMVTFSWKTANATGVVLSQPGSGIVAAADAGAMLAEGSAVHPVPGYPDGTPVPYQLTVEGSGPPLTRTLNVVVGRSPAITSFTGPEFAKVGSNFQLRWTTANADAIELSTGGAVFYRVDIAGQAADGGLSLPTPAVDTEYTLTALSVRADAGVTRSLTQQVAGPVTLTSFTATPAVVPNGGDPITLTWSAPGARKVTIVDADGHTVVSARGSAAESGTGTAYANRAMRYVLTATNTVDPPLTADAGVTVTTPADFSVAGAVFANNPFDISWSVGGPAPAVGLPTSNVVSTPGSTGFVDISTTGTRLGFADNANDAVLSFTPPDFETFMWGTRVVGPFTVSTNGFLVLGPSAATRASTVALPNSSVERNFLAPFWANLSLGADSNIYWQVLNEAPERTLVVQFSHLHSPTVMGVDLTFEVKVHQTGLVTFEYQTLNAATLNPVVGVQGPPNTGINGPAPAAMTGLSFLGPKPPPLNMSLTAPSVVRGFLKLPNGYLQVATTPNLVKAGDIGVSEVLYNPNPAIAATGEWFEVQNNSTGPIDLQGWTVTHGAQSFTVNSSVPVPTLGRVVLGQIDAAPGNDNVMVNYAYGQQFALDDTMGTLTLRLGSYTASQSWTATGPGAQGRSAGIDSQPHLVTGDTSTTAPHPIVFTSTTPFGTQTPQQQGTPGVKNAAVAAMQSIPVSYYDISGSGTPMFTSGNGGFDSNVEEFSTASAPFPWAGTSVNTVTASTNGFVVLRSYTADVGTSNKSVPSTSQPTGGVLSIFWDDLDQNTVHPSSNAYYKRVAPGEDAANPGGHWIVQWHHWERWLDSDDMNFQIKLFDTGVVEYHYATMTSGSASNYANGNGATVWFENAAGNTALVIGVNQPVITPNMAVRFTP
ncbi:MAG: lamin tail domain-containing protein [Myxococcaceae bacterium]|nr:lamin tail domain-containing protein [Myxococcaceae bacterium]